MTKRITLTVFFLIGIIPNLVFADAETIERILPRAFHGLSLDMTVEELLASEYSFGRGKQEKVDNSDIVVYTAKYNTIEGMGKYFSVVQATIYKGKIMSICFVYCPKFSDNNQQRIIEEMTERCGEPITMEPTIDGLKVTWINSETCVTFEAKKLPELEEMSFAIMITDVTIALGAVEDGEEIGKAEVDEIFNR